MLPFTRANGEAHPGAKACMVRLIDGFVTPVQSIHLATHVGTYHDFSDGTTASRAWTAIYPLAAMLAGLIVEAEAT